MDERLKQKFDCDRCGATVGGEWLDKHNDWHTNYYETEQIVLATAKAVVRLANPDRTKL